MTNMEPLAKFTLIDLSCTFRSSGTPTRKNMIKSIILRLMTALSLTRPSTSLSQPSSFFLFFAFSLISFTRSWMSACCIIRNC